MDQRFKKIFSVLIAVLAGAGIIFFAWKSGRINTAEKTTPDTDWSKSLEIIPQTFDVKTISATREKQGDTGATTTTDIVARELLMSYAITQSGTATTTLSDAEINAVAQTTASKIVLPQAKEYSEKDLIISKDNSGTSIALYLKEVARLTQNFASAQTKNDIVVAFADPKKTPSSTRSADIAQNIKNYEVLIKGFLNTKVPSGLITPHLHLVQKYANIQTMIKPMSEIFTDPLTGLTALTQYREEISGFDLLSKEYEVYISKYQQ